MDYFDGSKCKTSTPLRGSCKRLNRSIESSPIFPNTYVRTDLMDDADDDIFNSNLDENDFKELENGKKLKIDDNKLIKVKDVSNCVPKSSSVDIFSGSSGQSLLSVDNSFLKILDLNTLQDSSNKTICCKSSHTDWEKHFNSSLVTEDIGDDHAWDMSISAEIKHEHCQKNLCTFSQEVNNIFCDSVKWEDDTIINKIDIPNKNNDSLSEKHNVSFGSRIKTILLNNAQKPISKLCEKDKIGIVSQEFTNSSGSTFYGLPILVKSLIKKYKGINQLYDWQEECLKLEAVKNRKNLVYALPTSGGKTLVAEILILNELLCKDKNAIFVMPYVSIVQEKVRSLSPFAVELGFLIEEYAGAKGQYPPQKRRRKRTVFIATIEKALGLIHSYLENNRMSELGLVVVDELHLIGEPRRGATLESMLVKLLYAPSAQHVHIIGMSATIGNVNEIAQFLKADVYTHDFRPVELKEYIKVENEVFYVNSKEDPPLTFHSTTSFPYSEELKKLDPDEIGGLVREVAPHESCLVFCPSKKNCENVALLICQTLDRNFLKYMTEEKRALYKALASEGNGTVCSILGKTLPYGVAYHNSGLTTAERKLLEEAFCAKTIFCICCTSTLAAGVNLPAKRVILRSPYVGREFINLTRYKQMVGRAGRAGLSGGAGESFLICKPSDTQKVGELIHAPMDYCKSHLFMKESLLSFLISAIGLSVATTVKSLTDLLKETLLHLQSSKDTELNILVSESISQLISSKAVNLVKNELQEESLILTFVGKAAMKGGFDMETANAFYSDLETAKKSLVLLNHMHLLYLVTPYSMLEQIKLEQQIFIKKFMKLEETELQVASILGIDERCVSCMMAGRKLKNNVQEKVHRFYLSCILHDLWNEKSVWEVSEFYQITRGLVHTLLNSAVSFAASATRFCEELEDMWCFRRLLVEITSRLSHCCKPELIPLMELPAVKLGRARQLYEAGFKTVNIIANAEPQALVKAIAHLPRRVAHQIVAAAKLKLMTTAETLQEEAEEVLSILKNKMATV